MNTHQNKVLFLLFLVMWRWCVKSQAKLSYWFHRKRRYPIEPISAITGMCLTGHYKHFPGRNVSGKKWQAQARVWKGCRCKMKAINPARFTVSDQWISQPPNTGNRWLKKIDTIDTHAHTYIYIHTHTYIHTSRTKTPSLFPSLSHTRSVPWGFPYGHEASLTQFVLCNMDSLCTLILCVPWE